MRLAPLLAVLTLACTPAAAPSGPRPDVVVVLVDDLGWADVGYHARPGAPRTPRIDALAAEGLRLERCYVQPSCSPTRAGLLTGRLPARTGIRSNLGLRVGAEEQLGLPLAERLLAQDFRGAGYRTALVGKWHLGEAPGERPTERGFDVFHGCLGGMIDYTRHVRKGGVLDWWRGEEPLEEPGYATRLIADEAARLLAEDDDAPLFLVVSFTAPHAPLHVPPGHDAEALAAAEDPKRAIYVAMVEELDAAVGTVLDALDARERAGREALVLFLSDNGGAPKSGGSNDPLRGRKFQAFEGAIRVPAVLRGPGVPARATSEQRLTCMDVVPTLADAAGVELHASAERPLDGASVWPELSAGTVRAREPFLFVCEMPDESSYAALDGRWKLVAVRTEDGPVGQRLYDLESAGGELDDVAAEHPDVRERLWKTLEPWTRD